MNVPAPSGVAPESFANPALQVEGIDQRGLPVVVLYCPRNSYGGVFHVAQGLWSLYGPVPDLLGFLSAICGRVAVPDEDAFWRWYRACTAAPATGRLVN